jgi:hypothetical protein
MTTHEETKSEGTRTVSPPIIKRERFEDEEPERRVAQRLETDQESNEKSEEISEEAMVKIVIYDLLSNDEGILEQAMYRLGENVYDVDDEKRAEKTKAFFQVGGHLAVVSVMKKHPNCKMLQNNGAWVLRNATYGDTAEYLSAVAKIEGIQAILTAMKRFPLDRGVIGKGFAALRNIVCEHEANADLLVMKLGEVPFLVERMKDFLADPDVLRDACGLMWNLSDFAHLRDPIVNSKAVTALGSAIEIHRDDANIQGVARKALVTLLKDDSD